jgi:succinate dehydrogenase / fumarate reductase cytochrome b subunit
LGGFAKYYDMESGLVLLKNRTDKRPIFLNLLKIHLPVTALVSILHRVTGVFNILVLPVLAAALYAIAHGATSLFVFVPAVPVFLLRGFEWAVVVSFMYHILAGLRHLFHDFTGMHSLLSTVYSAQVVLVLWVVWVALAFVRLMWVL